MGLGSWYRRIGAFALALALVTAGTQAAGAVGTSGPRHVDPEVAGPEAPATAGGFDLLRPRLRRVDDVPAEPPGPVEPATVRAAPEDRLVQVPLVFPDAPPRPAPSAIDRRAFADVVPSGGTWAVVIGVNDYPGTAYDLQSAVADADAVSTALFRLGVTGDRRLVLHDASAATIREGVEWLDAHAGPDATAVFFFAGHIRKLDQDREALVGSDGGNVVDVDLAAQLDRLQAGRTWIGLAGCYAGGFTELVRPGRVLTAASPADQPAYESAAFGHSYLVQYLVEKAMFHDGQTTVEGAFADAQAALQHDYPNRVPVQFDAYPGNLDLRVQPDQGAGSPPPPPSSPPPKSSPPPTSTPPKDGCAALTVGVVRCSG